MQRTDYREGYARTRGNGFKESKLTTQLKTPRFTGLRGEDPLLQAFHNTLPQQRVPVQNLDMIYLPIARHRNMNNHCP
jgi:hypothetical protein